jgi:hypothetical protein
MVTTQVGLSWQPERFPQARIFAGYQYEYWWDVGRESTINSMGEMSNQGLAVRLEYNY